MRGEQLCEKSVLGQTFWDHSNLFLFGLEHTYLKKNLKTISYENIGNQNLPKFCWLGIYILCKLYILMHTNLHRKTSKSSYYLTFMCIKKLDLSLCSNALVSFLFNKTCYGPGLVQKMMEEERWDIKTLLFEIWRAK